MEFGSIEALEGYPHWYNWVVRQLLLAEINAIPQVAKVYCLNRSANGRQRQSRGLDDSWSDTRVEFLQADLSLPLLGLAPGTYRQLIDKVTVVIHCAWKVDFNLTIESFESQIRGVGICLILVFIRGTRHP